MHFFDDTSAVWHFIWWIVLKKVYPIDLGSFLYPRPSLYQNRKEDPHSDSLRKRFAKGEINKRRI